MSRSRSQRLWKVCAVCCCEFIHNGNPALAIKQKVTRGNRRAENNDNMDFNEFYKITMTGCWSPGTCTPTDKSSSVRKPTSLEKEQLPGNLFICESCQDDVSTVVAQDRRLNQVEKKVRQLQGKLLVELLKLEKELRAFFVGMEKIETAVHSSPMEMPNQGQEEVEKGQTDMNDATTFRRNIVKVVQELRAFNSDFCSKFFQSRNPLKLRSRGTRWCPSANPSSNINIMHVKPCNEGRIVVMEEAVQQLPEFISNFCAKLVQSQEYLEIRNRSGPTCNTRDVGTWLQGGRSVNCLKEKGGETARSFSSSTQYFPVEEDLLLKKLSESEPAADLVECSAGGGGGDDGEWETNFSPMNLQSEDDMEGDGGGDSDDEYDADNVAEESDPKDSASDSSYSTSREKITKPSNVIPTGRETKHKRPPKKMMKCKAGCGKPFKDLFQMLNHSSACNGTYYKGQGMHPRLCQICGKSWTAGTNSVARHRWSHMGEADKAEAEARGEKNPIEKALGIYYAGKQQCPVCGKMIVNEKYLKQHMQIIHCTAEEKANMQVQCHLCPSILANKLSLYSHMARSHNNGMEFQCHICSKKFNYLAKLRSHIKLHSVERPFLCQKGCGLRLRSKGNLRMHHKVCRGTPNNHSKMRKARLTTM